MYPESTPVCEDDRLMCRRREYNKDAARRRAREGGRGSVLAVCEARERERRDRISMCWWQRSRKGWSACAFVLVSVCPGMGKPER